MKLASELTTIFFVKWTYSLLLLYLKILFFQKNNSWIAWGYLPIFSIACSMTECNLLALSFVIAVITIVIDIILPHSSGSFLPLLLGQRSVMISFIKLSVETIPLWGMHCSIFISPPIYLSTLTAVKVPPSEFFYTIWKLERFLDK